MTTDGRGAMNPPAGENPAPLRILFLTQYYPPEVGAAPARAAHFSRSLVRAGHRVSVVTGLPNHPSGVRREGYRPGTREEREGVLLRRTWLHATPRKTPWTRLANHLSFAASALGTALRDGPYDLVLVTVPPLFIGVTAWLAAVRHRAPLIVDVRDDWPRAAIMLGEMRRGLVASALDTQAGFLYQRAARVLAVTPGMQRSLSARGIDAGRQVLITNGADTEIFRPGAGAEADPARSNLAETRPFTILYSGTHGLIHDMGTILDAAQILKQRGAHVGGGGFRFLFVGDGVAKAGLMESSRSRGLTSCEFRPSESPEELARTIRAVDLCVATTRDHPFSGETIPVKIFDYLAAGKPVIGAVSGDAKEVLRESGGGVIVPPGDGSAMAEAIQELADDPDRRERLGRAGPAYVEAHYSRRVLGERLAGVCEEVARLARGYMVPPVPRGPYAFLKRLGDLTLSGVGLAVLSPLLLVIAALIRLDSRGPALFRQRRPSRGGREFIMLKFRTMSTGTPDLATHLVGSGVQYVTRVGAFLRRTSLDELPQLWNILVGEMSLVGPRPALYNQYDLIALRAERGIDALRPGLTGWAQINGRDDIPLDQKVAYDEHYLRHVSLPLDLTILMRTFLAVFSGRGAR